MRPYHWGEDAYCRTVGDKDIFFRTDKLSLLLAQSFCDQCPVRLNCLDQAVSDAERIPDLWLGFRAGMTEGELREEYVGRRRMHRRAS